MLLVQLEYAVVAPCKGYHIYQVLWEPRVWEGFFVLHDKENRHDKHAVAVYLDKELLVFIGHLAQEIAKI